MKHILFFATLAFLISFPVFTQAQKVTFATLNWEPYIGKDLSKSGYIAQIIRESFNRKGHTVEFKFWPWARTKDMAQKGKVDAYGPEYYNDELKENFLISDSLPGGPAGLFRLKGSDINYDSLEDLKPYTIGVVRGYVNEEDFDEADFLDKQPAKDDLTNIKKLLRKRIDLFFADKYVGKWLAKENDLDASKLEFIKPMVTHELYICFPKDKKGTNTLKQDFNEGLNEIKEDGTLDKIIDNKEF